MEKRYEAEKAVLNIALCDAAGCAQVMSEADPEDFSDGKNIKLFQLMRQLYRDGCAVDLITVSETGFDYKYLMEISVAFSPPSNLTSYLALLKENRRKRELYIGLVNAARSIKDNSPDYLQQAKTAVENALCLGVSGAKPVGTAAVEALQRIGKTEAGLRTGFKDLDWTTGGFHKGELLILGARPSVGKTSFALNIALHIASNQHPVAIYSLETGTEALLQRALSTIAQANKYDFLKGGEAERAQFEAAAEYLKDLPLYISDRPRMTIDRIASHAYGVRRDAGSLAFIAIDYLGLIEPNRRRNGTREQEIAEITRGIKLLAGEIGCPVLLLSQLNRGIEARGEDAVPRLSDLRESGAIEQDADLVMLMHRDTQTKDAVFLNVAKNRNGKTGNIRLHWQADCFLFRTDGETWQEHSGATPFDK